jgi:hypothetical protein
MAPSDCDLLARLSREGGLLSFLEFAWTCPRMALAYFFFLCVAILILLGANVIKSRFINAREVLKKRKQHDKSKGKVVIDHSLDNKMYQRP